MADPVSLAITVALNAATMAMTAMQKIEGPRLQDLTVTTADYGTPLVQFYGTKRLECPCFYAENIREEKHKNKTKGGKYTEYKYFGTWASFIADHEITAVLKIWLDRHLVFDRTGNGKPIGLIQGPLGLDFKLGNTNNLRIYLGTEEQDPDPRLVAKIEAKEGAGMCPAYLGVSYMVFEEVPLEKFGNRMPQVSATATRNDVPKYPYAQLDTDRSTTANYAISSGGAWMAVHVEAGESIEWWHLPTRSRVSTSPNSDQFAGLSNISLAPNGTAYYFAQYVVGVSVFSALYTVAPAGSPTKIESDSDGAWFAGPTRAFGPTTVYTGINPTYRPAGISYLLLGQGVLGDDIGRDFCEDDDGNVWGLFEPAGASADFTITQLTGGAETFTVTGSVVRGSPGDPVIAFVSDYDHFAVITDGVFYAIDRTTGAIKNTRTLSVATNNYTEQLPRRTSFWSGYSEYSLSDGALLRSVDPLVWVAEDSNGLKQYDPVSDAIMVIPQFENHITWRFLDRSTGEGWSLEDICTDVALQAGYQIGEFDFSDLDQIILGWDWTQGPAKEIVGPLLEFFDSDVRPHGFVQQGLKRGQPLTADTISSLWMVPESNNNGEHQPLYSVPITAETDLPRRVWVTFADPNMEEQPNEAIAQRNASSVKTERELSIDMSTLTLEPAEVQPLLERALRRAWVGAVKPQCRLTPLEMLLEPADVRTLLLEGEWLRCRNTRTNIRANRIIDTEWELDGETLAGMPDWLDDVAASIHVTFSTPAGLTNGREPDEVPIPVPTQGFVLDTVLLADAHDQATPFLYDAAGPYVTGGFWPGAGVWVADDNEPDLFSPGWDSLASDEASTWGFCQSVLGDALAGVIDEASTMDVLLLGGGELSSITETAMLNSQAANQAQIGQEVVQFRDVELIDVATYRLSGLVRGARGSEWAMSTHVAGEKFVLLTSRVHRRTIGASEIGDTDFYKFSTSGDDVETAEVVSVEFAANANRPLSPAHIELTRNSGTGDWSGTFVRRTRVGGSTLNNQDVPLGETSELYRVRVLDPNDPDAAPIRTIEVTAQAFSYTAAQQVADWGSARGGLTVEIVQVSPSLSLEGFAARASKVEGPPQLAALGDLKVENDQAITVAFPTDQLLAKDVAILFVQVTAAFGGGSLALPAPAGFQAIGGVAFVGGRHAAFWKRCDGSETTVDVAATGGGATNPSLRAKIMLWRGCTESVDPVEAAATATGNSASANSPAIATLGASRTAVNLISESTEATTMTPPAGYSEAFEEHSTAPFAYQSASMSANSKEIAVASTVAASTTTLSTSFFWGVITFALVPRVP